MDDCSVLLDGVVLTTGQVGPIIKKRRNYVIINSKFGYFVLPFYYLFLQPFVDFTIVEQRPDSFYGVLLSFLMYFRIVKAGKCSYRFTVEWMRDKFRKELGMRIFFKHVLPRLRFLFALDKQTEYYLSTLVAKDRVHFLSGLNLANCQEYATNSGPTFKIMFASSPLRPGPVAFEEKGVNILLEAFSEIVSSGNRDGIRLVLLWRSSTEWLERRLSELNIRDYVDVYSGFFVIDNLLRDSHISIFTPTSLTQSTHYPRSIMESLAAGRPVIVTDNLEISRIIERHKCGLVIKPSAQDLTKAIKRMYMDYANYQRNCRRTAEEFFDLDKNLKKCFKEYV